MPAELPGVDGSQPETPSTILATFRADARLRFWGAGLCAGGAIAFTILGYERGVPPLIAGPLAATFLLWSVYLLATFVSRRSVRYALTAQRLEIESGVLGRRCESVDLWRVRDLVLEQSFIERLRGVGRITVYSSDEVEPVLQVGPVATARPLFDRLRDAVASARKVARVVPLDQGR
jgi:membrane protein YdbS with pleckstrin-like domain